MNPETGSMISYRKCRALFALSLTFQLTSLLASANTSVHTSWMWHMHQPIYWPDRAPTNHVGDHYQNAWDTMQLQDTGFPHPSDANMRSVFATSPDGQNRIHDYQEYPYGVIQNLLSLPKVGAQL